MEVSQPKWVNSILISLGLTHLGSDATYHFDKFQKNPRTNIYQKYIWIKILGI